MFKKLRSTQRAKHDGASGHVKGSPTGHNPHQRGAPPALLYEDPTANNQDVHFGPREGRETYRLTNITIERTRTTAHQLSRRFTKFIQNMHGQVKIPHDLLARDRSASPTDQAEGERSLDVGQIPED